MRTRRLFRFTSEYAKCVFLLLLGVLMVLRAPLFLYVTLAVVGVAGFGLLNRYRDEL